MAGLGMNDAARIAAALSAEGEGESPRRTATVARTDRDGTIWVRLAGADSETPVERSSVTVKDGETVEVIVSNGRAIITGNVSNPSAQMDYAEDIAASALRALQDAAAAGSAAASAQASADTAAGAAQAAQSSADDAAVAAQSAQGSADQAISDAATAQGAAEAAQGSAATANAAAGNALTQLSIIEDVVGVLNWISEHASYAVSSDTEVEPGKFYFTRSGSGTSADPYAYSIVANPTGNPSTSGYYEIDDIDEAVSNYVMSHLALDNAGLWLLNDANSYRLLAASDGIKLYDASGNLVSTFGESIVYSSTRPQYIGGEDAYIVFVDTDNDGVPDTIRIGGNIIMGGDKTLSEVLADVETAKDICTISLVSTNGTVFKSNTGVSTTVNARVFTGDGLVIETLQALRARYGAGARLQWKWKDSGVADFTTLLDDDPRLSHGGFSLTVSPSDISTQAVINCELIY